MHTSRHLLKSGSLSLSAGRGFTLIELMVVIAVTAILLATAAPSFNDIVLGNKLGSYANNLVASASLARSEAIKRNTAVTLCVSSDGTSCTTTGGWEQGWIVLVGTTLLHRQQAASSGLKITEASAIRTMAFDPSGVGALAASLTVCRATPTAGKQERVVTISATGRAFVKKTTVGSCS
ncbi:MAG: methylation [Herminiimonas sp.]|nr:methylation [Herminiimonas sp.]